MGKLKTRKSVAKRFAVTGSGKVKFKRAALRHILSKRRRAAKRKLRSPGFLAPGEMHPILKNLPYGSPGMSR